MKLLAVNPVHIWEASTFKSSWNATSIPAPIAYVCFLQGRRPCFTTKYSYYFKQWMTFKINSNLLQLQWNQLKNFHGTYII
jgi:hypothetical protein